MSTVEKITAEGTTLAEATQNAAAALGVSVEDVAYEYDRAHLAGGAATIKIFASRRAPVAPPPREDRRRQRSELDPQRDEVIRRRAREAVQQVLGGSPESQVRDLNSYERQLVHTVVRETAGMTTKSIGEGLRKDVVVSRAVVEGG